MKDAAVWMALEGNAADTATFELALRKLVDEKEEAAKAGRAVSRGAQSSIRAAGSCTADPASFSKNVVVKAHRCGCGVPPLATFSRPSKSITASQPYDGKTVQAPRASTQVVRKAGGSVAKARPNSKAVKIETSRGGSRFCRPVQLLGGRKGKTNKAAPATQAKAVPAVQQMDDELGAMIGAYIGKAPSTGSASAPSDELGDAIGRYFTAHGGSL